MTRPTMQIFDAAATARLIPYAALVDALKRATIDYAQQRIVSPERLVVPLNEGGIMLSMPATAPDLAIHKLVNVCASNGPRGIPTIHGQVMAFDADTGETLFILDGPTVTGRRTAAMSMLGILTFAPARPREFLLIGTGTQAANHLEAIGELFPDARVWVKGSAPARAAAFCAAHRAQGAAGGKVRDLQPLAEPDAAVPASIDVVIALTTSKQAVYDEAARPNRLVIGVGAFTPAMVEIGARLEVVMHHRRRETRLAGNLAKRRIDDALPREQGERGIQQALALLRATRRARRPARAPRRRGLLRFAHSSRGG